MSKLENIERYNPDLKQGLSDEQVQLRKKQKLVNKSKKAYGKSYLDIIISNLFSFFIYLLQSTSDSIVTKNIFTGWKDFYTGTLFYRPL